MSDSDSDLDSDSESGLGLGSADVDAADGGAGGLGRFAELDGGPEFDGPAELWLDRSLCRKRSEGMACCEPEACGVLAASGRLELGEPDGVASSERSVE
ncbi:MAG: hypothetical protein ACKOAU_16485 [Pirellula sp.]